LVASSGWYLSTRSQSPESPEALVWHAIHVSGTDSSGDAHLFEFPDGKVILLDTGYPQFAETALIPYLQSLGISSIDMIVISHAHKNHYGALPALAENFSIKALRFTPPDQAVCATESDRDRCNSTHVENVINALAVNNTAPLDSGQTLYLDAPREIKLQVIHQANSLLSAGYETLQQAGAGFTINDSSAVLKLEYADMSVLLPGDIGPTSGAYLVNNRPEKLAANILAAPHHAVTPLPDERFFELVAPQAIIASVSMPPFVGGRGAMVRAYAQQKEIPLYITGKSGSITTTIFPDTFSVQTQR
jgi:competence protein ComEC